MLCLWQASLHASSWLLFPLPCFFKSKETLGPFVKQVLRPPAGTLRGPTCSFYCVLQYKLALGFKSPRFLLRFSRVPRGPREAPKRPTRGLLAAMPPRGPQDTPKRPKQGPKDTHIHPCSNMFTHMFTQIHTCSNMFTHVHTCSHRLTHVDTC